MRLRRRYRQWKQRVLDHESFLDAPSQTGTLFNLCEVIPDELLDKFCEQTDFLSFTRLLSKFKTSDHAAHAQAAVARMNILLCNSSSDTKHAYNQSRPGLMNTPLVYDAGALHGLTPFRQDFIDYKECDIPVKDVSKVNRVRGIGTVMYKFVATKGDLLYLPGLAYHLATADIRLFSPQTHHQLYGGSSTVDGDKVIMNLQQQPGLSIRHDIEIPIDKTCTNLPMVYNVACSKDKITKIGHHFRTAYTIGFTERWSVQIDDFDYEFGTMAQMLYPCMGSEDNVNLS